MKHLPILVKITKTGLHDRKVQFIESLNCNNFIYEN